MKQNIPLPEYRPDQSNNSGVLLTAKNVFPALDGYRAVGAAQEVSDALASTFQGGSSAVASDNEAYLLAGTATNLYKLNTATQAWASLIGSLSVTGRWRFVQFGNYQVAVNGTTAMYEVDLDAGTAAAISGAPGATSIDVVRDFVVIGQAGGEIAKVQWSGFRDHTGWTDGTNQAGSLTMQKGGAVQMVVGGEYGIILQRERIVRMDPTGDPATPFEFNEISSNYGCSDASTVAVAGKTIFFRSDRGFMALEDGQALRRIGSEKVDRTFNTLVDRDGVENIYAAVDPENNLVMWLVPGNPGTIWVNNFELDRWSTIELSANGLFPGFTTSVKLDDLDALGYTDLDVMTISLDDPVWSGGNPRLYLVTNDNKVANLTGDALAADIELGNTELLPGEIARVRNVRPVWDGTGNMTLKLTGKSRLGDAGTTKTTTTLRSSGIMPVRVRGRHISTRIQVAAGATWKYIQGLTFYFEGGGER